MIAILTVVIGASIALGAIPESLRDIVLASGQREVVEVQLDGSTFHGLAPFSRTPYLLWPTAPVGVAHEREAAATWLRRASIPLGHTGFEARFSEVGVWHGHEVWRYQLVRSGIVWHDARVELHRDGDRLIGVVNAVAQPILAIEDPAPSTDRTAAAFVAVRQDLGYALQLAALE